MELNFISRLVKQTDTKIVMLVMDGLGGLARQEDGPTELEAARTPNLDALAARGICGLHEPIGAGITPGSGPAHLALFGYEPVKYQVGRGVLAALGVDFDLKHGDVAARGNFCSVDEAGRVTDRRAGRISTEKNKELCALLREIKIPGAQVFVETVKEHRFLLVLRGEGLAGDIYDTDPQETVKLPLEPKASKPEAQQTAKLVKSFLDQARTVLAEHHPANMVLLRGFAQRPDWPMFPEAFGLRAAAIALYPMYIGLARLIGMQRLEAGSAVQDEFATLAKKWEDFDFFYLHIKGPDSAGEDGDFDRKVKVIEETDTYLPKLLDLSPDVILVTGDHSTPALLKYHSWHPVPVVLYSRHCRADNVRQFNERACVSGGLGPRFPAVELMPLALANALRLEKFGA